MFFPGNCVSYHSERSNKEMRTRGSGNSCEGRRYWKRESGSRESSIQTSQQVFASRQLSWLRMLQSLFFVLHATNVSRQNSRIASAKYRAIKDQVDTLKKKAGEQRQPTSVASAPASSSYRPLFQKGSDKLVVPLTSARSEGRAEDPKRLPQTPSAVEEKSSAFARLRCLPGLSQRDVKSLVDSLDLESSSRPSVFRKCVLLPFCFRFQRDCLQMKHLSYPLLERPFSTALT
jgi:hypothetical protein